jgi:hypothetical protein
VEARTIERAWGAGWCLARLKQHLRIVALLVIALEFLLFRAYFATNIAPYYPRHHDQLWTYGAVYEAYFSIRDQGWIETFRSDLGGIKHLSFKGIVVPLLGLLAMNIAGPGRWALGVVNFAFFVLGQVALWRFFERRVGLPGALLAWGLFLFGSSHYLFAGGLDDLRFDHAGMVAFGMAFLALWSFLEAPGWRALCWCLAVFAFALATRSITMVYLLGAQTLVVAALVVRGAILRERDARLKLSFLLLLGSLVEFAVFLVVRGRGFFRYYGSLLVTDEAAVRNIEFGVRTLWDRWLYYPRSAIGHFDTYLVVGAIAGLCILAGWILGRLGRRGSALTEMPLARTRVLLLLLVATACSTFGILTLYSPSPVVIGVLTIPVLCLVMVLVVNGLAWLQRASAISAVALIVALLGLGTYGRAMTVPRWTSPQFRQDAAVIDGLFRTLADIGKVFEGRGRVQWLLVHDGVNNFALNTYLYEHSPDSSVLKFTHGWPTLLALSENELQERLAAADMVIVPIEIGPSPGFEYPLTRSLRDLIPTVRDTLDREFLLKGQYPLYGGHTIIGLYVRPVLIAGYRAPNSIERQSDGSEFFWLGNKAAEVRLYNLDASNREVVLVAKTRPGPSNAEQKSRTLQYEFMRRQGVLKLPQGDDWKLSLPLSVRPGWNSLLLWVTDRSEPPLNGNGDPRDLLLHVGDIKVRPR